MKFLRSMPLLVWVVVAIILGIVTGPIMPTWLGGIFLTYNSIFSGFLSFTVPLIILREPLALHAEPGGRRTRSPE